ncbi:MAG: sigma-70 family RNA polymerase sigma factor [Bacteroidia bacterium]|nr:sigma-70 family RNA polymerase sigma factor [Bacteroidia bacterium]MCO5254416.1 sigma-70 family RNA polymerase sigma factor [Bacteroidota bacterium]MCZ2129018.1 sigma-70 family RNA polymerase sigma factor [Bacteroidia bacterium]
MNRQQISDRDLIRNFIAGNEACMEMLVKRYKSKLYTTIYLVVQDTYIAEDIFQETFIKVIRTFKSGKYEENDKFKQWIMRIARNLAIDYYRKVKKMPKITRDDGSDVFETLNFFESNIEDRIVQNERERVIRRFVKELPEEQKEVLILRHYGDLSFKEISELTGISINTALGRMRYALINLRKMINTHAPDLNN